MDVSFGDIVFIVFICLLIAGIMTMVNRSRRERPANPPSVPDDHLGDELLRSVLRPPRSVAVIGRGDSPNGKDLHLCSFLRSKGFDVYPVNPAGISDRREDSAWRGLKELPLSPELIVICPGAKPAAGWVHSAIDLGARFFWLEEGVISAEAMEVARSEGRPLVMNHSLIDEYQRLFQE